jgi:hypothetical protein
LPGGSGGVRGIPTGSCARSRVFERSLIGEIAATAGTLALSTTRTRETPKRRPPTQVGQRAALGQADEACATRRVLRQFVPQRTPALAFHHLGGEARRPRRSKPKSRLQSARASSDVKIGSHNANASRRRALDGHSDGGSAVAWPDTRACDGRRPGAARSRVRIRPRWTASRSAGVRPAGASLTGQAATASRA